MSSRNNYAKHDSIWYFAGLVGLAAWLYWPSLSFWAVNDDFATLITLTIPEQQDFQAFRTLRPIERFAAWLNLQWFGYESLIFCQIVGLFGFLFCLLCVYALSRHCFPKSRWTPWIAALTFICSPVCVASIIQIDTLSQQYASVFTLLSCLLLLKYDAVWPALITIFLAMLSKETVFGDLAALPLAALWLQSPQRPVSRRKFVAVYAGIVILFGAYLLLRVFLGIPFTDSGHRRYNFSLSPIRLIKNGMLFFGHLTYAGSSLDIFPSPDVVRIGISSLLTAISLFILGIGLCHAFRHSLPLRPLSGLLLLMIAGFFPVGLLKAVSELYCYSAAPFYAILAGGLAGRALDGVEDVIRFRRAVSIALIAYAATLCGWLIWGTREKLAFRAELSRKSRQYFAETAAFLNTLPDEPALLCWNEPSLASQPRYSVFVMPDNYLLNYEVVHFAAYVLGKPIRMPTADMQNYRCDYEIRLAQDKLAFAPSQFSNDSR